LVKDSLGKFEKEKEGDHSLYAEEMANAFLKIHFADYNVHINGLLPVADYGAFLNRGEESD
jgi:hypothetical protein